MKTTLKFTCFLLLGAPCFLFATLADMVEQVTDWDVPGNCEVQDFLFWTLGRR